MATLVLLPCMYLLLKDVTMLVTGKQRTRTAERHAGDSPESTGAEASESEATV